MQDVFRVDHTPAGSKSQDNLGSFFNPKNSIFPMKRFQYLFYWMALNASKHCEREPEIGKNINVG